MRASGTILWRNVGPLEMESLHRGTFHDGIFRTREIAQRRGHVLVRSGDDSGEEPGDAASELGADGKRDLLVAAGRRVIVDAGETIHLQIDPAGGNEHAIV